MATETKKVPDRTFDEGRRAQGFKSQAHLDAFFRAYDHARACAECQKPGRSVELDDGLQPTVNRCPEGLRLERASWGSNFSEEPKAPPPCAGCGATSAPGDWLCGACRVQADCRLADLSDLGNVRGYVQDMRNLGLWDGE